MLMMGRREITPNQQLLADRQVAELLGIGVRTVWSLTSSKEIPQPIHIGRLTRWRRKDIESWIAKKR